MSYLIQPLGISNYQIKKVFLPQEINDTELKLFIGEHNLKRDTDFHRQFPDAQMLLTQPHKQNCKTIEAWVERKKEGIGLIIWKKL